MASLYDVSKNFRLLIVGFLIFSIFVFLSDIYSKVQRNSQSDLIDAIGSRRFFMNPDRVFGDISPLYLKNLSGLTYNTKDFTVTGLYPEFPDVAYVYQIEEPRIRANTAENVMKSASLLGFKDLISDNDSLNSSIYRWLSEDATKELTYDFTKLEWKLRTDFRNNLIAKASKRLFPRPEQYISPMMNMYRQLGFMGYGINAGETEIKLAILNVNGEFREVKDISQAEYVFAFTRRKLLLADLKPKELLPKLKPNERYPEPISVVVMKDDPRKGSINVLVTNNLGNYQSDLLELSYVAFNYLTNSRGAYFIITPEEAFTDLFTGKGFLRFIGPANADFFENYTNMRLTRVRFDASKTILAYYEPDYYQDKGLITPIYVFRGTAELEDGRLATVIFYVDAIKRI